MIVEDRRFDWFTSHASPHLTNVGHPLGHLRWTGKRDDWLPYVQL